MNWNIRYSKEDIGRAAILGKHLFAIGYNGIGRAEAFMYMDEEKLTLLWLLAHEINTGKDPAEAFAEVSERIEAAKVRLAARKATETIGEMGD